jgi:hypothetical protein
MEPGAVMAEGMDFASVGTTVENTIYPNLDGV